MHFGLHSQLHFRDRIKKKKKGFSLSENIHFTYRMLLHTHTHTRTRGPTNVKLWVIVSTTVQMENLTLNRPVWIHRRAATACLLLADREEFSCPEVIMKSTVKNVHQSFCGPYSHVGGGVEEVHSCCALLGGRKMDPPRKCGSIFPCRWKSSLLELTA